MLPSGRVRARRWGPADAPLLLCVPGLSANVTAFSGLADHLAGDDRQLVAFDLRGCGHSDVTPPGTYGVAGHADDAVAVADALGAAEFDAVGWSMGALILMEVARRHPVDLSRVAVAGLSAGASMAALLAALYPTRFCAVAMHSGVAPGTAESAANALAAMRGTRDAQLPDAWPALPTAMTDTGLPAAPQGLRLPPLLVLHGDEFDTIMLAHRWLAFVGDAAYTTLMRLNVVVNAVRQRMGLPYWSLSAWLKHKVKNAVEYISRFEEIVAREAATRGVDGVVASASSISAASMSGTSPICRRAPTSTAAFRSRCSISSPPDSGAAAACSAASASSGRPRCSPRWPPSAPSLPSWTAPAAPPSRGWRRLKTARFSCAVKCCRWMAPFAIAKPCAPPRAMLRPLALRWVARCVPVRAAATRHHESHLVIVQAD